MHLTIRLEASLSKALSSKIVFRILVWQLIVSNDDNFVTNLYNLDL